MNTSKRRVVITENQKQVMLEFLKKNNKLVSAKFSAEFTVKAAKQLWQEMAHMLNAIPGAIKNWHDWRKTWHDIRCRIRAKSMRLTNCSGKSDDNLASDETLNAFEIEVLSLIGETSLLDHQNLNTTNGEVCIKSDFNQSDTIHLLDPLQILVSEFAEDEMMKHNKKTKESHKKEKHVQPITKRQRLKSLRQYELKMKDKYFKRKLQLLERDVIAKERIAIALETMVNSRRR